MMYLGIKYSLYDCSVRCEVRKEDGGTDSSGNIVRKKSNNEAWESHKL